MLLRRITKHVRDQNWFAVLIDFVIVVIGVFIGIQVANWNEDNGLRAQEREIILQLIAEAQETNTLLDRYEQSESERLAAAKRAHQALKADELSDGQVAQLHADIIKLGPWQGSPFVTASIKRLIDADQLSLIADSKLRLTISRHYEFVIARESGFANVGKMNIQHLMSINDQLDLGFEGDEAVILSPIEELLENTVIERRVGQFVINYDYFGFFYDSSRTQNEQYLVALSQYAEQKGWLQ